MIIEASVVNSFFSKMGKIKSCLYCEETEPEANEVRQSEGGLEWM